MTRSVAHAHAQAVQMCVGELMYNKVDMSLLEPPPKPKKSPTVRKGTVDYSKWDDLDDDDDEDGA